MKALIHIFKVMAARQMLWLFTGLASGIFVIFANIALMAVSGWFIASMAVAGATNAAFNYGLPAVAIRALAISRTLGRYVDRLLNHEAAFRMLSDLRCWLFETLVPLAPAGLEEYAGSDISGRLRADVDNMENLYLRLIAPVVTGIAIMISAPLFVTIWSPISALVLFAALFASGVLLPVLTWKLAENPGKRAVALASELRIVVTEGLQGAEELLIMGASAEQSARVDALYTRLASEQRRLGIINGIAFGGVLTAASLAAAGILTVSASEVSIATISGPIMVMLLLFASASFEGIAPLTSALQALSGTVSTASRLKELSDRESPVNLPQKQPLHSKDHSVVFDSVSFKYGSGAYILSGFSLSVPESSCLALTGSSGAGKSSIMEILLRFRPYSGSIKIGGVELSDISPDDISSIVTAVPQRPHLFNRSIRDNILLGSPDADNDTINRLLADTCLYDWVHSLPEGIDTMVGVAGCNVSGGEAKRIALARALLSDAPILLLDEPTEGLDIRMEAEIVEKMKCWLKDKTVILATHRPACLVLAARVVEI